MLKSKLMHEKINGGGRILYEFCVLRLLYGYLEAVMLSTEAAMLFTEVKAFPKSKNRAKLQSKKGNEKEIFCTKF